MVFMVKNDPGINSMTNLFYTAMFKNFSKTEDSPVELMETTPMGPLKELQIPTGTPGTKNTPNPFGPGTLSPEAPLAGAIAGIPEKFQNLVAPSATSTAPDSITSSATFTASDLSLI